jgi:hypothetical protein
MMIDLDKKHASGAHLLACVAGMVISRFSPQNESLVAESKNPPESFYRLAPF